MLALLLFGCGASEGQRAGVVCEHIDGGLYGEIIEADGSWRPAFDCLGFWRCEETTPFEGIADAARDVWSDQIPNTERWCDRCTWAGEPVPLDTLGVWEGLASTCSWATP